MTTKHGLEADVPDSKRPKLDGPETSTVPEPSQLEQELAVGITAYISPDTPGFDCVVKQRYTDFLVNEILPNGEVLHLKGLPVITQKHKSHQRVVNQPIESEPTPQDSQAESSDVTVAQAEQKPKEQAAEPAATPESSISSEDTAVLHDIFGETTSNSIVQLYRAVLAHPHRKAKDHATVLSELISDKSRRTQAHIAVRRIFNSKLETTTLQDQIGVISIRAAPAKAPGGPRVSGNGTKTPGGQPKGKLGWDELGGEYLHFTLYKENKDTMEVLYFMASQLKVNIKNFQFAGTKDRRGVTVQRVSLFRIHADRVIGLNRLAKGWVASDFAYQKHGLTLGELLGNEFHLTLRNCRIADEDGLDTQERLSRVTTAVTSAVQMFRENGFINYYGLQRFGTFSTGTHMIGMKMLKGDLEGAVDSILAYDSNLLLESAEDAKVPQENIARARAIHNWRETGTPPASQNLPRRFQAEASIMDYLSRRDRRTKQLIQSRDWQGALMQIQRNLRLMYVHAYQSLVWNTAAGQRWRLLGNKVVAGDLVIVGEKDGKVAQANEEVDEDGEPIFHPAADDRAISAEEDFVRARPLSQEEADSGKYDIFDVVLPLPGFDVVYPANSIGKFYEEFMASEIGGGLDPHQMRRSWKDASLSGGYRKLLARCNQGVDVEVKLCADEVQQLVETDLERLTKDADADQNGSNGEVFLTSEKGEPTIAAVLKFRLGSSQYATMALRELTKGGATGFRPDFAAGR